MDYPELIKNNASPTEIQKYLVDGEMAAITIRIPKNLRDSAKEAAALKGMSFSAWCAPASYGNSPSSREKSADHRRTPIT